MPKNEEDERLKKAYEAASKAIAENKDFIKAFKEQYNSESSLIESLVKRVKDLGKNSNNEAIFKDERYLQASKKLIEYTLKEYRIVGGIEANINELKDCVALGNKRNFGATGVLIAPNAILTAGHNFNYVNRILIGNNVNDSNSKQINVKEFHRFSNYDPTNYNNDLMILILQDSVNFVNPRPIASSSIIDQSNIGKIAGFGNTDFAGRIGFGKKRLANIPIVSQSCALSSGGINDSLKYNCHYGKEIVAGRPNFGVDTCVGDSGGPIYVQDTDGSWVLGGITSRSTKGLKRRCGDGTIYVRVDKYQIWIQSILGSIL